MPLPSASVLANSMMASSNSPPTPDNTAFFTGIANAILTAIQAADVNVGTFAVPIVGTPGVTPLIPGGKGIIT